MDRTQALRVLRQNEVFGSAPDPALRALLGAGHLWSIPQGSLVFRQGQEEHSLYVVLTGRVRMEGVSGEGNPLFHRIVRPGEIFGEIALLDGAPRTAAAVAEPDCEVFCVDRERCVAFLNENPRSAIALATLLARRIRSTSHLLEDAIFRSARDRVARMLVELARTLGKPMRGGLAVEATHEEIGHRTGLHRVSVTNQLKNLQLEELIESDRCLILIRDVDRLEVSCSGR